MKKKKAQILKLDDQSIYFKSSEDMSELLDEDISLIVTSPPYWKIKDYKKQEQIGQEPYPDYLKRLNKVWDECYKVSRKNAILAININSKRHNKKFYPIAMDIYNKMRKWKLFDHLIWYKPNALPQPNHYINRLFDDKYEDVLLFAKNYDYEYTFNKIRVIQKYKGIDPRKNKLHKEGRCIGNIVRIPAYRPPNIKKLGYHEAAFPEELVYLLVYAFTNEGDMVLDPFLGSGTTLKVTKNIGRKGIGYELNEQYKELIKGRVNERWDPPNFESIDIIHSVESIAKNNKKKRHSLNDY